jgi:hypothetical protein
MKNTTEKELLLKLHDKVDTISDKIKDIEIVQIKHEENLKEHLRRSELAELRIEFIEGEVKPMLQGVSFLKAVAKFGTWLASILYAVSKFFQ